VEFEFWRCLQSHLKDAEELLDFHAVLAALRAFPGSKAELAAVLNSSTLLTLLGDAVGQQEVGIFALLVANGANTAHTLAMFGGRSIQDEVRSRASLSTRDCAMALLLDLVFFCQQASVEAISMDAALLSTVTREQTRGVVVDSHEELVGDILAHVADWKSFWKGPNVSESHHRHIHLVSNNVSRLSRSLDQTDVSIGCISAGKCLEHEGGLH
jgi:hypothetical protein